MRPAILIYNPAAGRTQERQLSKLLDLLRGAGFEAEPLPTRAPGDATRLARTHASTAIEVAFALGGDGTLREVAAGLLGSDVALGVLPAGTANVLTFELRQPRRPARAVSALARGEKRGIDVGMAGDVPFLMMVSGGFDAKVMATQSSAMKRRFGPAAVAASGLLKFWRWDSPEIELKVDGRSERVTFFTVSNIPFFGGPFRIAPAADASDGRLDLVTLSTPGRLALLGFVRDVVLGRHLKRPDVRCRRFEELEICGPLPWGLQTDGDVLDVSLPCRVTVRPRALDVLVPQAR